MDVLDFLTKYFFFSTVWIDVTTVASSRATSLVFQEFGRKSWAKRFINYGTLMAAIAWTLFLIGAMPIPSLTPGDKAILYVLGITCKNISQPLQVAGWLRFWVALGGNWHEFRFWHMFRFDRND